mmetsp:Transcript_33321/g.106330  ORF Transcript_33321/g.106330 Transcript_33321/m.106330 type:complete len:163 (-) Transcript_33321:218-706(-)
MRPIGNMQLFATDSSGFISEVTRTTSIRPYLFARSPGAGQEGAGCRCTADGSDYRGDFDTAIDGRSCIAWSSAWADPSAGISADHNHCRNPDGEPYAWCFVNRRLTCQSSDFTGISAIFSYKMGITPQPPRILRTRPTGRPATSRGALRNYATRAPMASMTT